MKKLYPYLVPAGCMLLLAGCGKEPLTAEELLGGVVEAVETTFLEDEEAYISADSVERLRMPPDLVLPDLSDQMILPDLASGISALRSNRGRAAAVLPEFLEIKMRKEGTVRWLEVGLDPVSLWPHARRFWQQQGFRIAREEPIAGILETDWLRRQESLSATDAQNDHYYAEAKERYLMRMEREPNAYTNIYVSRYGLEVAGIDDAQKVVWQAGAADLGREGEILSRLMQYLGGAGISGVPNLEEEGMAGSIGLTLEDLAGVPVLRVKDDFSSVWRQIGVALGRSGLSVLEMNRSASTYRLRGPQRDGSQGDLLEVRLLAQGENMTLVTVHAEPGQLSLSPEVARGVLQHVVSAYALVPRKAEKEE